jgi:hypothetical protein
MTLAELHRQKGFQQGFQQGLQQGEQRISRAIAKNLLREGIVPALVVRVTGIDIHTVQEIMAELQSEKV